MEGVYTISLKKKEEEEKGEGHSYIFSHYFIIMEMADSAEPHRHMFCSTEATSSA